MSARLLTLGRTLALLCACVAGCTSPSSVPGASEAALGPRVAQVGTRPIYRADVVRARARQRLIDSVEVGPQAAGEGNVTLATPDPAQELALRRGILQQLVERALLLQAAQTAHVVALHDEVEAAYAQLTYGWQEEALTPMLRALDVTVPELKAQLRESVVTAKLLGTEATCRVVIRDADVDAYIAAHPQVLAAPTQLRLRQAVVATQEQVAQMQAAMRRGASFAELAARLSQAPEAAAGGDLGLVSAEDLPAEMAEVCFALKPRTLSRPVSAADGLHLFWVSERLPAHALAPAEVRGRLERKLRGEEAAAAAKRYLTHLQEQTHVEIFADNLADDV